MPYQITQKRFWWLSSLGRFCGKYLVFLVSQGDSHFIRHNDYPLLLEESRWSAHPPELPACPYCYYMKTEAIRQYEQIGAICIFTAGFSIGTNLYLRT